MKQEDIEILRYKYDTYCGSINHSNIKYSEECKKQLLDELSLKKFNIIISELEQNEELKTQIKEKDNFIKKQLDENESLKLDFNSELCPYCKGKGAACQHCCNGNCSKDDLINYYKDIVDKIDPDKTVDYSLLADAALSYDHGFGLYDEEQKKQLISQINDWRRAIGKAIMWKGIYQNSSNPIKKENHKVKIKLEDVQTAEVGFIKDEIFLLNEKLNELTNTVTNLSLESNIKNVIKTTVSEIDYSKLQYEYKFLKEKFDKLQLDVDFLVRRMTLDNNGKPREKGISSNSLVNMAYGVYSLKMPMDQEDLDACELAFKNLPEHRKTEEIINALNEQRSAIKSQIKFFKLEDKGINDILREVCKSLDSYCIYIKKPPNFSLHNCQIKFPFLQDCNRLYNYGSAFILLNERKEVDKIMNYLRDKNALLYKENIQLIRYLIMSINGNIIDSTM